MRTPFLGPVVFTIDLEVPLYTYLCVHTHIYICTCACIILTVCGAFPSAREKLALLIGNSTYSSDQVNNLSGPENDVYKLAKALQKHDFKVLSYVNLKYDEMLESFEKFASYLKKLDFSGVYALFYYSGHGFRFGDTPYLVPTDAMTPLECDKCISSQNVKACFGAKPSLLILDSCQMYVRQDIVRTCTYICGF